MRRAWGSNPLHPESHGLVAELFAEWLEHGPVAIARLRTSMPCRYLRLVAAMSDPETEKQLSETIARLDRAGALPPGLPRIRTDDA